MSEKIYVVTRGDYSDYHIITATTDFEHANEIAKKFKAKVEIYDDSEIYLKNIYSINFDEKGNVVSCYQNNEYNYPYDEKIYWRKDNTLYIQVEADDEQSAIKIAAEKRAKSIAEIYDL